MAAKVSEAIENYFKLKAKYEKKYNSAIKNIRENPLTTRELEKGITKKNKVKSLKINCVGEGCTSFDGTYFKTKGTHLLASCGSKDNPCGLNIDIDRGVYLYLPTTLQNTITDLNSCKIKIIQLKLDLLFDFSTEEEIAQTFENLKLQYSQLDSVVSNLNANIIENNLITIEEIPGEYQSESLERTIQRNELVKLEKIKLENLILRFSTIIKNASIGDWGVFTHSIFMDAIEQYINKILPLIKSIQKYNYDIQTIINVGKDDNKIFKLVQIKNTLKKNEIELESPKIISNIK